MVSISLGVRLGRAALSKEMAPATMGAEYLVPANKNAVLPLALGVEPPVLLAPTYKPLELPGACRVIKPVPAPLAV